MSVAPRPHPPLALALGGGGVRGAAHLGVLRALEEAGLEVSAIAGTSSGAIAAMLYALERLEPDRVRLEAYDLVESIGARGYAELQRLLEGKRGDGFAERFRTLVGWERVLRAGVFGPAITTFEPMRLALTTVVGDRTFEDLPIPVAMVATDLESMEKAVLRSGALVEAALASSAVPGVVPPVRVDGRLLVDGHVIDNVPAAVARDLLPGGRGVVLAVDGGYDAPAAPPRTALEVILRAAMISREHLRRASVAGADVLVSVGEEQPCGVFDTDHVVPLFEAGYELTRAALPRLHEALDALREPEPENAEPASGPDEPRPAERPSWLRGLLGLGERAPN